MAEEFDQENWRNGPMPPTQHIDLLKLFAAGVLVVILVLVAKHGYEAEKDRAAFELNLTTELLGIAVTVLVINWFGERRAERQRKERLADSERQAEERYKRQLVDEAASTSNEIAKHAVHVMRRRGWLKGEGSLLKGVNLSRADLHGAFLRAANLQGTNLTSANLSEADLADADLRNADLSHAKLQRISLSGAKLKGANLSFTDLSLSHLWHTKLEGLNLAYANMRYTSLNDVNMRHAHLPNVLLQGAVLVGADMEGVYLHGDYQFDETTVLPDGKNWSEETDMKRFTDPNHKEFWRSRDSYSPAFDNRLTNARFIE